MPAASNKTEMKSSPEAMDTSKQILIAVDKKLRNLEKRKGKLDVVRNKQAAGETLEREQKDALQHYEEVVVTLDFIRDMQKQFLTVAAECEKLQKKHAKREKQERSAAEVKRVAEILEIQATLDSLGTDTVRQHFKTGKFGAVVLTEDNLVAFDELYQLISPSREGEGDFADKLTACAEQIISLVEGRERAVGSSTYKELLELIRLVSSCGYFEKAKEAQEAQTTAGEPHEQRYEEEEYDGGEEVDQQDVAQYGDGDCNQQQWAAQHEDEGVDDDTPLYSNGEGGDRWDFQGNVERGVGDRGGEASGGGYLAVDKTEHDTGGVNHLITLQLVGDWAQHVADEERYYSGDEDLDRPQDHRGDARWTSGIGHCMGEEDRRNSIVVQASDWHAPAVESSHSAGSLDDGKENEMRKKVKNTNEEREKKPSATMEAILQAQDEAITISQLPQSKQRDEDRWEIDCQQLASVMNVEDGWRKVSVKSRRHKSCSSSISDDERGGGRDDGAMGNGRHRDNIGYSKRDHRPRSMMIGDGRRWDQGDGFDPRQKSRNLRRNFSDSVRDGRASFDGGSRRGSFNNKRRGSVHSDRDGQLPYSFGGCSRGNRLDGRGGFSGDGEDFVSKKSVQDEVW